MENEAERKKRGKSKKCSEVEVPIQVDSTNGEGHHIDIQGEVQVDKSVEKDPDVAVLEEIRNCTTSADPDAYASEYENSDEGYNTPNYDSEDEAGHKKNRRWPVFDPKTQWNRQEPSKGMLFSDSYQLRHCLINYAVANGREIKFEKMSKSVVLARCKKGCKWRLYATKRQMDDSIQVKSYYPHHNKKACVLNFMVKIVTSRWLAKEYASDIRENPKWGIELFKAEVLKKHKINVTPLQCYRARQFGLTEVESVLVEHYARLWDYREELLRSNPGSTVVLEATILVPSSPPLFDKLYICFSALKNGWLAGCRPVIGLDGCFLKTFCKGQLLCAVGRDGNNHMFPIAWAVVESESTETWTWFLNLLNKDIGFDEGHGLTFISDQQKGLLNGLTQIFPFAEHRNCARHIYANFRKRFNGVLLRNLFWKASKCSTETEFWAVMDEVKKASNAAYDYLKLSKPQHWCRGFFSTISCCDNVENNLSETFNSCILKARKKPIISMLEDIRQGLMARLLEKKEFLLNHSDNLCPRIRKKLELAKDEFKHWQARHNGDNCFEVRKGLEGYSVDLVNKTCSCRMWQLSGIPCQHAVSAICYANEDCDNFVYPCLLREEALKAYQFTLQPVNGQNLWPKSANQPMLPPTKRRGAGRPKILRYREWGERKNTKQKKVDEAPLNPCEIDRKGRKIRCTNCNEWGHNKRYCKNTRVEGDKELDRRRNSNKRKERPSTNSANDGSTEECGPDHTVEVPFQPMPMENFENGSTSANKKHKLPVKRASTKRKTKLVSSLVELPAQTEDVPIQEKTVEVSSSQVEPVVTPTNLPKKKITPKKKKLPGKGCGQ